MSARGLIVGDLRARARFFASITSIGIPREAASGRYAKHGIDRDAALRALRDEVEDCRRCRLAEGRKHPVFGQGNPAARLLFVGEAPGGEEDRQGLPFVGAAGQLLTRIIEAIDMKRSEVFIANIIKCRPPQNRTPQPDEILQCQEYLERQIEILAPEVIVALGKVAAQWLLRTAEPITRIRGKLGEYRGIPVMPTFHPAYLLRNPNGKRDVWKDMKEVRALLRQ
ncbi:MAG: uracil-DNA glycosylase [Vicinamibacteria bacterium]|nr:uracil-DNA glycosylase [Vicinamibacteria bacterium]